MREDTVTVEFLPGGQLRWTRSVNVNSGDTERPPITATADPRLVDLRAH